MLGYQNRIQGTDRLLRIRRIRKAVFGGLFALTIVLMAARLAGEGASLKPLFLPINGIIEVSLIMGLLATVVGLYLRNLEVHNLQRDNQRYLMAKYSMTRAVREAGFSIGIAVILLLAVTPSVASTLFSDPPQVVSLRANGTDSVVFASPDPLGISFVTHAIVSVTTGAASVFVMRDNVTMTSAWLNATDRISLAVEPTMWARYANWSLVFHNQVNQVTYLTFILEKGVMPTLFTTVPFLLFLYGAAQIGWWVGLRPIRERTKATALSAGTEMELDSGERVYDPTATSNPGPAPEMAFNFAAAPPPPPPVMQPPPPPTPTVAPVPVPTPKAEPPKPAPRPPVRQPETPASLVTKADALMSAGTFEAALSAYDEALRLDPGHIAALQGKARALIRMDRRPEGYEAYRRVLTKDPKNLETMRSVARLQVEDRRWRECLETVDGLLRVRPNDAPALEMKGDALTNLGRRPEALAAYEGSAAIDPSNENVQQKIEEVRVDVPSLLSRALIASASGSYPQALNLFDDILEVDPSNVNALIGKAVAYRRSGKPQEALNCLDLVLGVQANNASALLNRGNILLEEGDLEGALDAFDRLTQLYPNDEEAWAAQGDVLVKMGRDDDALRAYTEAQKMSPGDETIQRRILELEAARPGESDIFEELRTIKGIGQARAKALIDAGFRSAEDFAKASLKDLSAVRGVTRKIAEDLVEHFKDELAATRAH
ncbi:MAG TPA: tetratricopeptide repeat protein [Thermoplasmata archaeon]|nr:tetratricopeptide repeat protein [Thermoplasmata archaeon]